MNRTMSIVNRSASLQFRFIHRHRERQFRNARGRSPVSGTGSFYSARSIGLQASAGAAEHEARSWAGKILATVVDAPSKSVSCRWVASTCDDVRCFLWTVLRLNWCCAICMSRCLIWQRIFTLTLSPLMFLTNSVVVITEFVDLKYVQYQWIGKVKNTLKSNAPQTSFL